MAVVLTRIDDRLIHGQIIQGWIPALEINNVVVVSDDVAADSFRRELIVLALPPGIGLETCGSKQVAGLIKKYGADDSKTLFLTASPEELVPAVEAGAIIKTINLGGMHHKDGSKQLANTVFVTDSEMDAFSLLLNKGVKIEVQAVPTDKPVNFKDLIN